MVKQSNSLATPGVTRRVTGTFLRQSDRVPEVSSCFQMFMCEIYFREKYYLKDFPVKLAMKYAFTRSQRFNSALSFFKNLCNFQLQLKT